MWQPHARGGLNCFSVLLGNGDGTLQAAVTYDSVDAEALAAADLAEGGRLDLVVGNLFQRVLDLLA